MRNAKIQPQNQFWIHILSRPLIWDTIATTSWSTIGKAVGFLVPFFIAAWFGVTSETDVFFFAYGFVIFLTGIFASSIESVIVPFIAEIRAKDEKQVGFFVGSILILSLIGLSILGGVFLLIAKPFLSIVTRFSAQQLNLLLRLLVEITPLLIFLTLTSILSGTLNAYKIFRLPAVSPAFRAVITIGIIFLFKAKIGVHAIAFGYIAGEFFRLLILLSLILNKNLFPINFSIRLNPKIIEFLRTATYQSICLVAGGLNSVIDKTMASWLERGSVTVLHYADRLYMIPVTFMSAGLLPVVLSYWSQDYYQKKDTEGLFRKVKDIAKLALGASLIVFLLLVLLRQSVVHLVFARGKFPLIYLPIVQWTWVCYLFGLAPYVIGSMFVQAHLALKNTGILMKLGLFSCCLNVVLNYILMQFLGVSGIALSTSITALIIAILLFIFFRKKVLSCERTTNG